MMVVFVELLQWIVDLTNAPNKSLSIQLMIEKNIAMTMSRHECRKAVKNVEVVEEVELGRSVDSVDVDILLGLIALLVCEPP